MLGPWGNIPTRGVEVYFSHHGHTAAENVCWRLVLTRREAAGFIWKPSIRGWHHQE